MRLGSRAGRRGYIDRAAASLGVNRQVRVRAVQLAAPAADPSLEQLRPSCKSTPRNVRSGSDNLPASSR